MGLVIGDALGVPVEFVSRDELKYNPVTDMIGYGTHNVAGRYMVMPDTTNEPVQVMTAWLRRMQASDIRLCVVSRVQKPRVVEFCKKYGLDCITHAKKPFQHAGIRVCVACFPHPGGVRPRGRPYYTDVLGANCAGMTSILVSAIHNHTIWLKLRHIAELPFIAIGRRKIQHEKH